MKKLILLLLFIPLISFSSFGQHIEPTNPNDDREHMIYYNKGYEKFEAKDYYGAIYEFTKSIEAIDFIYPPAYINRALCKAKIGDLKSAFDDIDYIINAIGLDVGFFYYYRGVIKLENEKNYYGAIADFMKAIEIDGEVAKYRFKLGLAKEKIGDLNGACADWKKAARLGDADAAKWVANQCN